MAKPRSGKGLSAGMAKQPRIFGNLTAAQKRKVLEMAIEVFGVKGLKGQKHLGFSRGGFPDLSGDGKTTQKDILIGKGVIKAKAGTLATKRKSTGGSKPKNPKLYAAVKSEAKSKFKVYPSAYANAWLVRTYKARGGKY